MFSIRRTQRNQIIIIIKPPSLLWFKMFKNIGCFVHAWKSFYLFFNGVLYASAGPRWSVHRMWKACCSWQFYRTEGLLFYSHHSWVCMKFGGLSAGREKEIAKLRAKPSFLLRCSSSACWHISSGNFLLTAVAWCNSLANFPFGEFLGNVLEMSLYFWKDQIHMWRPIKLIYC